MHIKQARQHVHIVSHRLFFEYNDSKGAGFSFPCNREGWVNLHELTETARVNYHSCLEGRLAVKPAVIEKYENNYWEPAIGLCNRCQEEVVLSGFTNTCEGCETDYNMSGQQLAPRSCWGEETGESVSDILAVDYE